MFVSHVFNSTPCCWRYEKSILYAFKSDLEVVWGLGNKESVYVVCFLYGGGLGCSLHCGELVMAMKLAGVEA